MSVCPLLTIFGFLHGRAAAVGTSDIFLFLGLGLYLAIIVAGNTATTEADTLLQNTLKIVFLAH